MRSVAVAALDGTEWMVRVAWEPRWRFLARRFGGWRDQRRKRDTDDVVDGVVQLGDAATTGGGGDFDLGDAIIVIVILFIAIIAAAVLFWWVLLPLLLLVLDLAIVLILLVLALAGRVLFRRPWTVEARSRDGRRLTEEVVGWRAALRRRDELANELRLGHHREPARP